MKAVGNPSRQEKGNGERIFTKARKRVEIVVMDMSPSFKAAFEQALGKPIVVDDRFHLCRYIYLELEKVRKGEQKSFMNMTVKV